MIRILIEDLPDSTMIFPLGKDKREHFATLATDSCLFNDDQQEQHLMLVD